MQIITKVINVTINVANGHVTTCKVLRKMVWKVNNEIKICFCRLGKLFGSRVALKNGKYIAWLKVVRSLTHIYANMCLVNYDVKIVKLKDTVADDPNAHRST